jgi:hypothetical protein
MVLFLVERHAQPVSQLVEQQEAEVVPGIPVPRPGVAQASYYFHGDTRSPPGRDARQ